MPPSVHASAPLIAGRFTVDPSKLVADAGGGLSAYAAASPDAGDGLHIAIAVARAHGPRLDALERIRDHIDNLMTPSGHGVGPAPSGGQAYYVVCTAPPGPLVSAVPQRWTERALVEQVLKPTARTLLTLQGLRLTHRAIRPDNVFLEAPGQFVTLGAAWAAPPAMHQPAIFETPYTAMCEPAARGDGAIADDVYALGVLMLCLAIGTMPCAGMSDDEIIRAKLEHGSFGALSHGLRLPGFLTDLLSGMLAEDPDHRPSPQLLLDPNAARARRVASSPPRRSHDPLPIGEMQVFDARTLAFAMFRAERRAVQGLRNGAISNWLRRGLGNAGVAQQIEELARRRRAETRPDVRSDAKLVMRAIAVLDPRMPLCWRGVAMRPDGLTGLLSAAVRDNSAMLSIVQEIFAHNIPAVWHERDAEALDRGRRPLPPAVTVCQSLVQSGVPDGLLRAFYLLHPLQPCAAPGMASAWVTDVPELLSALEAMAATAKEALVDPALAAFIAARCYNEWDRLYDPLLPADAAAVWQAELKLLRQLQAIYRVFPLPRLAAWAARRLQPGVDTWRNRTERQRIGAALQDLARGGDLRPMIDLVFNRTRRQQDEAGEQAALGEVAAIDREIAALAADEALRAWAIRHVGAAMVGGLGLVVLIVNLLGTVSP